MTNLVDFEDILKEKYGEKGTEKRDKFDADSLAFRLGVMKKEAQITQGKLAKKGAGLI